MRKALVVLCPLSLFALLGCAAVQTPLVGTVYTDVQFPSYYDGVDNGGPGLKKGQAMATSILGIVATGDASVAAAARNGGIKIIHTADTHATSVLGIYATYTTVVTGE